MRHTIPTPVRRPVAMAVLMAAVVLLTFLVPIATANATSCDPQHVGHSGRQWIVVPSEGDDTMNIQCALDEAAASGQGADVRLAPGGFTAGLLTGTNFRGTFRGTGVDETSVVALPDLDCQGRIDIGRGTTWIYFNGGDVTVADITLEVTDPTPCAPWSAPFDDPGDELRTNLFGGMIQFGGPGTAGLTDCDDATPHHIDGRVANVALYGPKVDFAEEFPPVNHGVWIAATIAIDCPPVLWWPVTGDFSVQGSHFEGLGFAVDATAVVDGTIVVGGQPGNGNTFDDVAVGVSGFGLSGSRMVVSNNDIRSAQEWGVVLVQGEAALAFGYPVEELSELDVRNNFIHGVGSAHGIGIIDLATFIAGDKSVDAQIVANHIDLADVEYGGVFGLAALDVIVKNNLFTGAGATAAVYHGVDGDPSGNWQIVGNDVGDFEGGVAKIWLGSGTFDDYVKTMNPGDDVLDEGTDNTVLGPRRTVSAASVTIDHTGRLLDRIGAAGR